MLNQNIIHLLNKIMKLKVVFVSLLTLLVALAVNPANASSEKNKELLNESMKYQAYLQICLQRHESFPKNCEELYDTRGPYKTKINCKRRISEMISDLPKYKSKFEAIGYICETGLREDLEFTKLD